MTRILLLVPFLLWLIWVAQHPDTPPSPAHAVEFLGGYAALVLFMAAWARWLARRIDSAHLPRHLRIFNLMMFIARIVVVKWFAIALFAGLGWGQFIGEYIPLLNRWPLTLPAAFIATLPAYLAWMGLWWAQYPAERAFREQTLLDQLENDLPVYRPARFWSYFSANLRMQILFTVIPIMLILGLRDVAYVSFWRAGWILRDDSKAEPFILLASSMIVFLLAPLVLKTILRTGPLPDSTLRQRLEELCRRSRLRYRDILLWQTDNNMGNAAVMGLLPQVRYILLSDLLLETMSDEQIEAVFAHELGHIVHRHMAWYVVLVMTLMLGMLVVEVQLTEPVSRMFPGLNIELLASLTGAGMFILVFGFLSRRFERQADVYAARTIECEAAGKSAITALGSSVGPHGARVFSSALHRVAIVNNIPIGVRGGFNGTLRDRIGYILDGVLTTANNWLHGSIASRMDYLKKLADDPQRTGDFDRRMIAIYTMMLGALVMCTWAAWVLRDKLMS